VTDARNGVDISQTPTPVTINNPDLPEVEITNPSGYDTYSGTIDVTWTATDNDEDDANLKITLQYTDDIVYGGWTTLVTDTENDGSWLWDISDMPDGNNYMLKCVARDSASYTGEYTTPNKFIINNENGPVVKLSYPTEGVTLTGKKSVYWSATDDEDADQTLKIKLEFSLDDGATWTELSKDEKNDGEYLWHTYEQPDSKNYKLKVFTKDSQSMEGFAISDTFEVFNNDDPVVAFTYPTEGVILEGSEVTLSWDATDQETDSGELKVTLEYKMGEDAWSTIDGAYDVENTGEFIWDTTELEDGEYTLRLTVKDSHGAMVQEESALFNVYNADPPVIDLLAPKEGRLLKNKIDIKWDAYDEDEGNVIKVDIEYSTDNQKWNTIAKAQENTGSYNWDTKSAPDGDCYIRVIAKDDQFEVIGESGKCRIDNSINNKPTVTIKAPDTKDVEIKGTYKIEWSASDPENDPLTITLQYSKDKSEWLDIDDASYISNSGSFNWDTTNIADNKYYLRIVANDGKLQSDPVTSKPFIIHNSDDPYVPGDDDIEEPDDTEESTGLSTGAMIGITSLIVVLVLAAIIIIIVLVVVMGKKKKDEPVSAITEPVQSPTSTMYGTATTYGQYDNSQQMGAGQQPQQMGGAAGNEQNYYLPSAQDQNQQQQW
jgi:hypothetical protein